jgi:hypothetical protein
MSTEAVSAVYTLPSRSGELLTHGFLLDVDSVLTFAWTAGRQFDMFRRTLFFFFSGSSTAGV